MFIHNGASKCIDDDRYMILVGGPIKIKANPVLNSARQVRYSARKFLSNARSVRILANIMDSSFFSLIGIHIHIQLKIITIVSIFSVKY